MTMISSWRIWNKKTKSWKKNSKTCNKTPVKVVSRSQLVSFPNNKSHQFKGKSGSKTKSRLPPMWLNQSLPAKTLSPLISPILLASFPTNIEPTNHPDLLHPNRVFHPNPAYSNPNSNNKNCLTNFLLLLQPNKLQSNLIPTKRVWSPWLIDHTKVSVLKELKVKCKLQQLNHPIVLQLPSKSTPWLKWRSTSH